jgi:hypothetical protein
MEVGELRRCGGCGQMFAIHVRCRRGHEYCGDGCGEAARKQVSRQARARHQKSPLGRLDHRDRNRAFRAARKAARVMDLHSKNLPSLPAW